jgi:hypothetical protein
MDLRGSESRRGGVCRGFFGPFCPPKTGAAVSPRSAFAWALRRRTADDSPSNTRAEDFRKGVAAGWRPVRGWAPPGRNPDATRLQRG